MIKCSDQLWNPVKLSSDQKEASNIFKRVLKDFGLGNLFELENLPSILNINDVAEALFTVIFAPSVPVICDPTGQFEEYVKKFLMQNIGETNISAADLFAN